MHLLLITDNFYPEGNAIASRVYERACYWTQWGHHVTVITSVPNFPEGKVYPGYKNKWFQVEFLNKIRVIRVKTWIAANKGFLIRVLDFLSFMWPAFWAGVFQKKPDLIVTTSPQFFGAITACMLAKYKRVPFVLEIGDLWPASIVGVGAMQESWIITFLEKLELWLYRQSHAIMVVSPAFRDNLVTRGVPVQKISVILNGVDLSHYRPRQRSMVLAQQYHLMPDHFVIGYIGTHGMAHGLENVLYAAKQLEFQKKIVFIFVGAGAERENLMAQAAAMQLDNVQFIPAQPKETIADFWSLCHVALVHFKNASAFTGAIPSKIFEAMGMGLPILLAAPQGVASALITEERVGLWVPPEDPAALAAAIVTLYHDPLRLQQLAKTSQNVAHHHTRETQAKHFLHVCEALV